MRGFEGRGSEVSMNAVISDARTFFVGRGFKFRPPLSLLSDSFSDTYNPSGGHDIVCSYLALQEEVESRVTLVGVDPCYRHVDLALTGTEWHSAFFEMLTFIDVTPVRHTDHLSAVRTAHDFLVSGLGLDPRRLLVSVFGGGSIKGAHREADVATLNAWKQCGIAADQISLVCSSKNYLYTENEGDGAGPRSEIFYLADAARCYIEIGTVIFEIHRFNHGRLVDTPNCVSGAGFGLERLAALCGGGRNVHEDVPDLAPIFANLAVLCGDQHFMDMYYGDMRKIISSLRALYFIVGDDSTPSSPHRRERVRKLYRELGVACHSLGLSEIDVVDACGKDIRSLYTGRHERRSLNADACWSLITDRMRQRSAHR